MAYLCFDEDQQDADVEMKHLKMVSNPKTLIENAQHDFIDPNMKDLSI
jgi:hypothetical protein